MRSASPDSGATAADDSSLASARRSPDRTGRPAVPQVDGFLNICKPLGWTSHDVVGFVRGRIGQRRVGHAGTLDPAAAGVLPLCLGRATRLAERIAAGTKIYGADIVLGVTTDSGDADGRVLDARPAPA